MPCIFLLFFFWHCNGAGNTLELVVVQVVKQACIVCELYSIFHTGASGVINAGYYDFTGVLPEEEKQRQQISRTSSALLLTACDSRSRRGCGGLLFLISFECAGPVSISHENNLLSSRNIQVWQDGNYAFNLSPARICSMETLASWKLLICHCNGCMWVSGIKRRTGPDTVGFFKILFFYIY